MTNILKYPEWQTVYQAAITELDDVKLLAKAKVAEETIVRRLKSLDPASKDGDERMALNDALGALRILMKHPEAREGGAESVG